MHKLREKTQLAALWEASDLLHQDLFSEKESKENGRYETMLKTLSCISGLATCVIINAYRVKVGCSSKQAREAFI